MIDVCLHSRNVYHFFSDSFQPVELPSGCSCRKFQVLLQHATLGLMVISTISAIFSATMNSPFYCVISIVVFSLSLVASHQLRQILLAPHSPPPPIVLPSAHKTVSEGLISQYHHESPQPDHVLLHRIQDHVLLKLHPSSISPEKKADLLKDYEEDTSTFTPKELDDLEKDLIVQEKESAADEKDLKALFGPEFLKEDPVEEQEVATSKEEVIVKPSKRKPVKEKKVVEVSSRVLRSHVEEVKLHCKHQKPSVDAEVKKDLQDELKAQYRRHKVPEPPPQPATKSTPYRFTCNEIEELERDLARQDKEAEEDDAFLNTLS